MNPFGQLPPDVMCHIRGLSKMVGMSKTPTAQIVHDHITRLPWVMAGIISREWRNQPVVDVILHPYSFGYHACPKCDKCMRAVDYDTRTPYDFDRVHWSDLIDFD